MPVFAVTAALLGVLLAAGWGFRRWPGSRAAAVAWLGYAGYEALVQAGVLCPGECNIRVDLLLIWPVLALLALAVPVRGLRARWRRRGPVR